MPHDTRTRFLALFRGATEYHGQFKAAPDGSKLSAKTEPGPVPPAVWDEHFRGGAIGVGISPITSDNACFFGALDVDDDDVDHPALAAAVAALRLPLVVCRSKSGGAHLFVFLLGAVPAATMRERLQEMARALHVEANKDGRLTEIFPKQATLRVGEQGNWINLPYHGGDDSPRFAVNDEGRALSLDEFVDFAESRRVDPHEFAAVSFGAATPFDDGPPCLVSLHAGGIGSGSRNIIIFQVARYFRLKYAEDYAAHVHDYNAAHVAPPLPRSEVDGILSQVERRDYGFKCNEAPFTLHCNKAACKKRDFGINAKARQEGATKTLPQFGALTRINTQPPTWLLRFNGVSLTLDTQQLASYAAVRLAALDTCAVLLPPIKQDDWDKHLRVLLAERTDVAAPEDAGAAGQFRALVREFVQLARRAVSRDDVVMGIPVPHDGRVWFRSSDLLGFLSRRRVTGVTSNDAWAMLHHDGADSAVWTVRGVSVPVWGVAMAVDTPTPAPLPEPPPADLPAF